MKCAFYPCSVGPLQHSLRLLFAFKMKNCVESCRAQWLHFTESFAILTTPVCDLLNFLVDKQHIHSPQNTSPSGTYSLNKSDSHLVDTGAVPMVFDIPRAS